MVSAEPGEATEPGRPNTSSTKDGAVDVVIMIPGKLGDDRRQHE